MTRLSLSGHPFLLGFDEVERMVERAAKSGSNGYPPYNIEMRGENAYRITLAVAGFKEADLDITI
ncbi:MAG: heat-shock protein Hsp20, partial [Pseudomonadota bacterium]